MVEFIEFTLDDLVSNLFGLAGFQSLSFVYFLLTRQYFGGKILTVNGKRVSRSDVHGEVFDKIRKGFTPRGEVSFTVYFHHHPYLATCVDIGVNQPLTGCSPGPFTRNGQAFLSQVVYGLLQVALGLLECRLTVHNPGVRLFAQLFYHYRSDLQFVSPSQTLIPLPG